MNKTAFIQTAAIQFLSHPVVLEAHEKKRMDLAIRMSEALWTKLSERGYGAPKRSTKEEPQGYYGELPESSRIAFDKLWKASGKVGNMNKAAQSWNVIENNTKLLDQMLYAMKVYVEKCHKTSTSQQHLVTWLNQSGWEGFEPPKATESAVNQDRQEIAGLEKMIDMAKDEESKAALRAQVITLIEGMKI